MPVELNLPESTRLSIIGRRREFERLVGRLDAATSSLLLVSGEDGMGKTTMLTALDAEGQARGWSVARGRAERALRILPATSSSDLPYNVDAAFVTPLERSRALDMSSAVVAASADVDPFVTRLVERAPALVLVDGYRPSEQLSAWFEGRVVPELRASGAAVVLVIADRPQNLVSLRAIADEAVELGALDRPELDEWFVSLGEQLTPPVGEAERRDYVDAVIDRPDVFLRLTRVLALTLQPEPREGAFP